MYKSYEKQSAHKMSDAFTNPLFTQTTAQSAVGISEDFGCPCSMEWNIQGSAVLGSPAVVAVEV